MLKSTLCVLATAALLAPVASADTVTFKADIEYSPLLLETDDGAAEVLASITSQAEELCTIEGYLTTRATVDEICVSLIIADATSQITDIQISKGKPSPQLFADTANASKMLTAQR